MELLIVASPREHVKDSQKTDCHNYYSMLVLLQGKLYMILVHAMITTTEGITIVMVYNILYIYIAVDHVK